MNAMSWRCRHGASYSLRLARRTLASIVTAVVLAGGATTAQAADLMQVYRQALQTNPVLHEAEAQHRVGQAGVAQSRAPLLPHLNAGVAFSDSHGSVVGPQMVETANGPVLLNSSHTGGRSRTDSIGLQQVLFDLGKFSQLKASQADAASTAAQLADARQRLILRVAQAYFAVLAAEDNLTFAKANVKALQKQLDQAQAKFKVGSTAITDVADAKAQHGSAAAQVLQADYALFSARQALDQITGQPVQGLASLADKLPLRSPQPDDMHAWVQTALTENPALEAQRDLVQAATHQLAAAHAARLPTLDASIDYSRTPQWSQAGVLPNIPGTDNRTSGTTVGLVLNVPLFAGGAIHAGVRKALAQRDQTHAAMEQDRRSTVVHVRNAFKAITTGIGAVQAEQQTVVAAKTALASTLAGYRIGTQTIVNALIAQENYFQALSARSQARYALVIDRLDLKYAAGTLSVKDLETVNALLQR